MEIPERDNVACVSVDSRMWATKPENDVPGWRLMPAFGSAWLSVADFEQMLDSATEIHFFSPVGREIRPGE